MAQPACLLTILEEAGEGASRAKASWLEAVEALADNYADIRERFNRLNSNWPAFEASVKNGTPEEDLTQVIDAMCTLEATLRACLEQMAKEREGRAVGFSLPIATPRERARGIAVADRLAAMFRDTYSDVQVKRLWLLARRAELEDSGDSPVFDDPEKLLHYLHDKTR